MHNNFLQSDYRRSVMELDEKQGLTLRLVLCELRNQYVRICTSVPGSFCANMFLVYHVIHYVAYPVVPVLASYAANLSYYGGHLQGMFLLHHVS